MKEKYQVFVSSTYEDLKAERDEAIKAVLEMGHIPVGMEMFSSLLKNPARNVLEC